MTATSTDILGLQRTEEMRTGKRTRQIREAKPKSKKFTEKVKTDDAVYVEFARGALGPEICDRCRQHFVKGFAGNRLASRCFCAATAPRT